MLSKMMRRVSSVGRRSFMGNATDAASAVAFGRKNNIGCIDLKFTDFLGTQHHITISKEDLTEDLFKNGIGFDGSSIRCWQPIHRSDMLMIPRPETACIDPFFKRKTISFNCDVIDPLGPKGPERYTKDSRYVLSKTRESLKNSGVCDHARVGPELEFFIFDDVRYSTGPGHSYFHIDSDEAAWNSAREEIGGNKGYKLRHKEGYFPSPPGDQLTDIRNEMCEVMENLGIRIEANHHEVATAGQCEIDFQFGDLLEVADKVQWYKYVVKNVARQNNKVATFMPKPVAGDNGSGMHQHYSLHDASGKNLFTGDGHAGLSQLGLYFIGGLIKNCDAVLAFTNPLTNSYRRLIPGYEAPIYAAYSGRNRSAFVRIPLSHPKGRRVEFRTPDPCCNAYFAFAACIQAGMDGIRNKIDPGLPTDIDLYKAKPEDIAHIKAVPCSLDLALKALEDPKKNAFLRHDNVFTDDVIESYVERKKSEIGEFRNQPTPWEFENYLDA